MCRNCNYFHKDKEECRYNPPIAYVIPDFCSFTDIHVPKSVFARTDENDWCGQLSLNEKSQNEIIREIQLESR